MSSHYKILVVDDSPLWCEQIQELLEEAGFEVITAHDQRSALKELEHDAFDVLVVDVNLNDSSNNVDGLLINRYVQRNHVKTRVILMSARSLGSHVRESIRPATFIEKSDLSRQRISIVNVVNDALLTPLDHNPQEAPDE